MAYTFIILLEGHRHLRSKMSCALDGRETEFLLFVGGFFWHSCIFSFENADGKGVIMSPKCWIMK